MKAFIADRTLHVSTILFLVIKLISSENQFNHSNASSYSTMPSPDADISTTTEVTKNNLKSALNESIEELPTPQKIIGNASMASLNDTESSPKAEKFIGARRRIYHPEDMRREKMKGMIFIGRPELLKPRSRAAMRRKFSRPNRHFRNEFYEDEFANGSPGEILKPLAFVPSHTSVEFPIKIRPSADTNHRRPLNRMYARTTGHSKVFRGSNKKPFRPYKFGSHSNRNSASKNYRDLFNTFKNKHSFSRDHDTQSGSSINHGVLHNTIGPDFGPVTYEDFGYEKEEHFGHNQDNFRKPLKHPGFDTSHKDFENSHDFRRPQKLPEFDAPHKNEHQDIKTHFGFSNTKFGDFDNFSGHRDTAGSISISGSGDGSCVKYTEDICLDTSYYPHEEILSSLAQESSARNLIAEVRDQSADNLVDGLTASQENKYNYAHYFGNRRIDSSNNAPRDFAQDGGFLCPSEIKYARPKRARNSKGKWKFIVNLKKYSQTLRMEKCLKPGGTCSYVSHHYRATCNQIHNYHRLLSWNKKRGIHMDIYKVPTCCACHIEGYAFVFPPLDKNNKGKISRSGDANWSQTGPFSPDVNHYAPPYSPVNFPNLEERSIGSSVNEREDSSLKTYRNKRPRLRQDVNRIQNRRDDDTRAVESRINYGYHPIIDFF